MLKQVFKIADITYSVPNKFRVVFNHQLFVETDSETISASHLSGTHITPTEMSNTYVPQILGSTDGPLASN